MCDKCIKKRFKSGTKTNYIHGNNTKYQELANGNIRRYLMKRNGKCEISEYKKVINMIFGMYTEIPKIKNGNKIFKDTPFIYKEDQDSATLGLKLNIEGILKLVREYITNNSI